LSLSEKCGGWTESFVDNLTKVNHHRGGFFGRQNSSFGPENQGNTMGQCVGNDGEKKSTVCQEPEERGDLKWVRKKPDEGQNKPLKEDYYGRGAKRRTSSHIDQKSWGIK